MTATTRHPPDGTPTSATFTELDPERCKTLLTQRSIGRVAWQAADGPQLFPITYGLHDDMIVFRTSPYGLLSELIRPTHVVFEVDDLDEVSRSGWNVIVRGRGRAVPEPAQLVRLWAADTPVPWATGMRNLWIAISIDSITGRLLRGPVP